jgi:hypothetical protein
VAERGFITLSIDLSYWGESEGEPRNVVAPDMYAEDFSAAADFLGTRSLGPQYWPLSRTAGAYPIYIIHMIFLYLGSLLLFPLNTNVYVKFVLVWIFTVAGCFAKYEFFIRRINFIRILFGLKVLAKPSNKKINTASAELAENLMHICQD